MSECNGICLYGADLGVPEYGGVAYAHPDCPAHGDPDYYQEAAEECDSSNEGLRFVREADVR